MSESILTIKNPPKFLTASFLTEALEKFGYTNKVLKFNIIYSNDMPEEIELILSPAELKHKFLSQFYDSFFDKNYGKIKLKIEEGKSDKGNSISSAGKKFLFPKEYARSVDEDFGYEKDQEGLVCTNKDMKENMARAVQWLIKKIGESIKSGQSLMNISLPVYIFDKRTMLQTFCSELRTSPFTLNKVYYLTNPVEKLKYMTVFFISQLYHSTMLIKPFNPVIGETYQIKLANMNIYLEQTAHKPPTASFYIFDDEKLYKFYGYVATTAETGVNSCKATKRGKVYVQFKDGFKYRLYYPNVNLTGTSFGTKTFNYKNVLLVVDEKSKLVSYIKFNPEHKGMLKSFFSKKKEDYPDKIIGKIVTLADVEFDSEGAKHELSSNAQAISEISGHWTKELAFDGINYWERKNDHLVDFYEPEFKLPSDSSFREDMDFLIHGKEDEAQKAKEKIENLQRRDRKLREGISPEELLKFDEETKTRQEKLDKKEQKKQEKKEKNEQKEREKLEKKEKKDKEKMEKKEKKNK